MKRNICRVIAAFGAAALLGLSAQIANADTVNLGAALPSGPVPPGYGGFDWGSAINDSGDIKFFYTTAPAAAVDQFTSSRPFDLTGVTFQNWMSDFSGEGQVSTFSTVVSGYLNSTLVKSVTENYGWGQGVFSGMNIDDVNKITFSTSGSTTYSICCDSGGNITYVTNPIPHDTTFVSSITVNDAARAPEIDPESTASALTLLAGGLAVLRGRKKLNS
jgi:hypothetical protein